MDFNTLPYNIQLKMYKKDAKNQFIKLYKKAMRKGLKKHDAIKKTNDWISEKIGKEIDFDSMDNLNISDCLFIIELIKPYIKTFIK